MRAGPEEQEAPPPLFGPLPPEDRAIALRATIMRFESHLPGRTAGTGGRPTAPDRRAEALAALAATETGVAVAAVYPADLARIAARLRGRLQDGPFPALLATPSTTAGVAEDLVAWVLAAALVRMREAPRSATPACCSSSTRTCLPGSRRCPTGWGTWSRRSGRWRKAPGCPRASGTGWRRSATCSTSGAAASGPSSDRGARTTAGRSGRSGGSGRAVSSD